MEIIINTPGTKLRVDNGMLMITNRKDQQRLPMNKVTSILIYKGCSLSSDLVYAAADQNIDLVFGTRTGKPAARLWGNQFGSIATIRKKQILFAQGTECSGYVCELIKKKIQNQMAVLLLLFKPNKTTDGMLNEAIAYLDKYMEKFDEVKGAPIAEIADTMRGWEGYCSKRYFECINLHLPVQYRFERRSQHPATDIFNSMLNYCYGMLYGKVELSMIRAGIDPYLGLFHRDEYNRPVFVYDVIEIFRYWADITVINLCMQQIIFPEFFDQEDGGMFLNGDGKRIVIQSFNDYLDEVVMLNNLERSRSTHIDIFMQETARMFKEYQPKNQEI